MIQSVEFYKGELTQKKILEVFNVSRTTYDRWEKQILKDKEESELVNLVKKLCNEYTFKYGYRKIAYLLNNEIKVNKNTVQKKYKRKT